MTRLGRYTLIEHLGDDPPWKIYLARSASRGGPYRGQDRDVVLRHLTYEPWDDEGRAMVDEAHLALRLEHANIEAVLEWEQGDLYCVTKLVRGWRLDHLVDAQSPIPVSAACHIVLQLCKAFRYLHDIEEDGSLSQALPRQPLAPESVLISTDLDVLIRNPGLAYLDRRPPALASLSSPKLLERLSPEEVIGLWGDHQSDVYHLGLLLYELVTAERIFNRKSSFETIDAIRDEVPPQPSLKLGIPKELDRLLLASLSKDPAHRQDSASDLEADIVELQRSLKWTEDGVSLRGYIEETGLGDTPRPRAPIR